MKRTVALGALTALVVLGMFAAGAVLFWPSRNPCESIFQQTALKLESNIKLIQGAGAGLSLTQERIQELSDQSQRVAVSLKTCCIMAREHVLGATEFLKCQQEGTAFEARVGSAAAAVEEARSAQQRGATDLVAARLAHIERELASAAVSARALGISPSRPQPSPPSPPAAEKPVAKDGAPAEEKPSTVEPSPALAEATPGALLVTPDLTVSNYHLSRSGNVIHLGFVVKNRKDTNILVAVTRGSPLITDENGKAARCPWGVSGMKLVGEGEKRPVAYLTLNPGVATPVSIPFDARAITGKLLTFRVGLSLLDGERYVPLSFGRENVSPGA